jgi:hypothetical protein
MGASISSNTASALADVSNSITNNTSASQNQINNNTNIVNIKTCKIFGDNLNINQYTNNIQKNSQIVSGISNSNVENDIQQKLLQTALSTVGSMGVGYANASNSASMTANVSNDIKNTVSAVSNQISEQTNTFSCEDSFIQEKNINITQGASSNFLSDQVVKSQNITKLANQISQTAEQKATAKVQGLSGFIIALAILIIAIGYAFSKPITSILSSPPIKLLLTVGLLLLLTGIGVWMYLGKCPPLFNDNNICNPNYNFDSDCEDCINNTLQKISIDKPPIKYMFPIVTPPSSSVGITGNLVQMVISASLNDNQRIVNDGYNCGNISVLDDKIQNKITQIQNDLGKKITLSALKPLLVNKNTTSGNYYQVPDSWIKNSSGNSCCTPGYCQYESSATEYVLNCKQVPPNCDTNINTNSITKTANLGIANINIDNWQEFEKNDNNGLARIVLLLLLEEGMQKNIDLSIYINDDDIVRYKNENNQYKFALAKDVKDKVIKFTSLNPATTTGYYEGSGTLYGNFGVCNDRNYKIHQFSRKIGIWIFLLIVISFVLYIIIMSIKNRKKVE